MLPEISNPLVVSLKAFLTNVTKAMPTIQLHLFPRVGKNPMYARRNCSPWKEFDNLQVNLFPQLPHSYNIYPSFLRVDNFD